MSIVTAHFLRSREIDSFLAGRALVPDLENRLLVQVGGITHASEHRALPVVQVKRAVELDNLTLIKYQNAIVEGDSRKPMRDA